MLKTGCIVMPREKGDSEAPGFYSLNNNIGVAEKAPDVTNNSTPRICNPRLRVRSNTCTSEQRAKPMLLQKQLSRTSHTQLDQILTNCNTKAMRYYRIWIYTCNAVLLVSMLGFCAVAGKTILGDYRRHLIPSLALYQPSFLYAYLAIFTQSGVIQIVGCLGALRLSERLLNVYWLMLLVLLFGDIVIGIFWMFRLDKMIQELRPGLKFRLYSEYGHGGELTVLWDRLQLEGSCCGVQSPLDFTNIRGPQMIWAHATSPNLGIDNTTTIRILVPPSCCTVQEPANENNISTIRCTAVHQAGCEDRLRVYLRQTSETLFLIGYCVIAFVKVCFIGILRYEIREMIQKIKLLKAELESRPSVASIDLGSNPNLGTISPSQTVLLSSGTQNQNGSVRGVGIDGGTESERESLLVQDQETPAHKNRSAEDLDFHQKSALHRKLFPGDSSAADSESHCALLVEETTIKTPPNGNNNYEMREFQQPQQQMHNRQYRMSNPDTQTHNM